MFTALQGQNSGTWQLEESGLISLSQECRGLTMEGASARDLTTHRQNWHVQPERHLSQSSESNQAQFTPFIINSLRHYSEIKNVTSELQRPSSFYYRAFQIRTKPHTGAAKQANNFTTWVRADMQPSSKLWLVYSLWLTRSQQCWPAFQQITNSYTTVLTHTGRTLFYLKQSGCWVIVW